MTSWVTEFGDQFRGRSILVTGATGFIGTHLSRVLINLGAVVTGLSRSMATANATPGVTQRSVDLRRLEEVTEAVRQVRASLIFHLAGQVGARRERDLVMPMFETSAMGAVHLLTAVSEVGCDRFMLVGTSEALGWDNGGGPGSPYAASKMVAEAYERMFHRLYRLPLACLCPFLTYGPGQDEPRKLIPYTILALLRGERRLLSGGQRVLDAV